MSPDYFIFFLRTLKPTGILNRKKTKKINSLPNEVLKVTYPNNFVKKNYSKHFDTSQLIHKEKGINQKNEFLLHNDEFTRTTIFIV